ncbi:hypothetical protein [Tardiphaga sp.]|uniref:hypothetical protein n=1 Tax=Tardiphaga sp. TaxID=1926292 RepID=UPI0037D9B43D
MIKAAHQAAAGVAQAAVLVAAATKAKARGNRGCLPCAKPAATIGQAIERCGMQ